MEESGRRKRRQMIRYAAPLGLRRHAALADVALPQVVALLEVSIGGGVDNVQSMGDGKEFAHATKQRIELVGAIFTEYHDIQIRMLPLLAPDWWRI